jgi:tRNA U34 5-methylaminomethyl-2-thiouridine-forming methyltransferase MnmC
MSLILNKLVQTQDGTFTLRHPDYDEEFHSNKGARFEANSLYMDASGFRRHLRDTDDPRSLAVLDVGLGLGYNALATIESWMQGKGAQDLLLISLEQTADLVAAVADPSCAWKQGWSSHWQVWSAALQDELRWQATFTHPQSSRTLRWQVLVGDAREADLSSFAFDYIWQDAFSPRKNPELWSIAWFEKLCASSHPSVQLVTYSVARMVRDHMEAAGWMQERVKTPQAQSGEGTGKKQWLLARLRLSQAQENLSTI